MLDFFLYSFFSVDLSFCLVFDYLSIGFFMCVSIVSSVVFLYRIFYIEGTVDIRRFSLLVFLFVASMFFLVFSGNFFVTMVGWDGLGLVSFCLVIFYSNATRLDSGLVTVFRNRIGDVFFLVCFFLFSFGGWWGFDYFSLGGFNLFLLFLFFGAITKRAQFPFSAWLPAAIAAPTPVSSLVHSSTLVTAGIYVMIRYNYIFFFLDLTFFKVISIFTIVFAGAFASFEKDFKKVVAISTLSQLGIILFIIRVGSWVLSFLHIVIHAFFKRILFLGTGSIMGQLGGSQESRFYGGNFFVYFSFIYFFVSCFCLIGFPFFIGFYSKDLIISRVSSLGGLSLYYLFFGGCCFTVLYGVRLIFIGYYFLIKSNNFVSFNERFIFFVPVRIIFLVCWVMGGTFYWFFLAEVIFFFNFFDLVEGLLIISLGRLLFFIIKWGYPISVSLGKMIFFQWLRTSGSSGYFSSMKYHFFEVSWLESFGGRGVYLILGGLVYYVDLLKKFGLGSAVLFGVYLLFNFI